MPRTRNAPAPAVKPGEKQGPGGTEPPEYLRLLQAAWQSAGSPPSRQLSRIINISHSSLHAALTGRSRPTRPTVLALARVLTGPPFHEERDEIIHEEIVESFNNYDLAVRQRQLRLGDPEQLQRVSKPEPEPKVLELDAPKVPLELDEPEPESVVELAPRLSQPPLPVATSENPLAAAVREGLLEIALAIRSLRT